MSKYIRVRDFNGNEQLIAMNSVRAVHRVDREERADIVEDYNGRMYECFHDLIQWPSVKDCIVEL